jgi:hypothetical protein
MWPNRGVGKLDERDGGEHALEVNHGRHGVGGCDLGRLHGAVVVEVQGVRQPSLVDEEALP